MNASRSGYERRGVDVGDPASPLSVAERLKRAAGRAGVTSVDREVDSPYTQGFGGANDMELHQDSFGDGEADDGDDEQFSNLGDFRTPYKQST